MDYFNQVSITGFWLGKANGRGQQEIEGRREKQVYIPFALSLLGCTLVKARSSPSLTGDPEP